MPRFISIFALLIAICCKAQDTCAVAEAQPHHGLIGRLLDYLDDANKPKTNKPFDFSVLGGPHYSSDKGFGIGLVAAAEYRMSKSDSLMQPSTASLYANATTGQYFSLGLEGLHIFPSDKIRINYKFQFESFKTYFWGIGYEMAKQDANKTKYKYFLTQGSADFGWRVGAHVYLGPKVAVAYMQGRKFSNPVMWDGLPLSTFNLGVGFTAKLDSRDFVSNAYSGWLLCLDQLFYPRFVANKHAFTRTTVTAAYYHKMWKGAVGAVKYLADITYGNTPWGLMPTFGGSYDMRGYYEGQYRDKCAMSLCVELRQYIWKRFGAVVWGGVGQVFPDFKKFNVRHTLPNYGVGIRWEFKHRMNVRLDYGFGRHCSGFVFNISEAF